MLAQRACKPLCSPKNLYQENRTRLKDIWAALLFILFNCSRLRPSMAIPFAVVRNACNKSRDESLNMCLHHGTLLLSYGTTLIRFLFFVALHILVCIELLENTISEMSLFTNLVCMELLEIPQVSKILK